MRIRKHISRSIRDADDDGNVVADVNAAIAANIGERDATTTSSTSTRQRIVQRNGRTVVNTVHHTDEHDDNEEHTDE